MRKPAARLSFLKAKKNLGKINEERGFSAHLLIDSRTGLYVQNFFTERLYLERKRCERSKKCFMLMLLNIGPLVEPETADLIIHTVSSILFTTTREIDLKGWYRYGTVIGALFIEIDPLAKKKTRSHIRDKTLVNLHQALNEDQVSRIEITFHFYPEDDERMIEEFPFDRTLYPESEDKKPDRFSLLIKRTMDLLGSAATLLLLSPVLLIIAAAIRISSQGPALFRQDRIGRSGRIFTFLKFRSMYVNLDPRIHQDYIKKLISGQLNENVGQDSVYKITHDPRVTPFGRILRKTSLDELPQFINVLKGEMSLVGPRPPIPYEFMDYDAWHRNRVLGMKPGITGLWQVMGRSTTSFNDMVRLDLNYIRNWSLWLDIKIIFRTPWVVIAGKGAY